MADLAVQIWCKACPKCHGDLRFEDDHLWQRFVCYQCGRTFDQGAQHPNNKVDLTVDPWQVLKHNPIPPP